MKKEIKQEINQNKRSRIEIISDWASLSLGALFVGYLLIRIIYGLSTGGSFKL
jgi:hypothetical protein